MGGGLRQNAIRIGEAAAGAGCDERHRASCRGKEGSRGRELRARKHQTGTSERLGAAQASPDNYRYAEIEHKGAEYEAERSVAEAQAVREDGESRSQQ